MKFGLLKVFALVSIVSLAVALNACGDDSSTSSPAGKLPTEVKDLKELEEHKCDMSVIGEKVFVESEDLLYECDGDAWFKSYDQTKPNSAKSSSSTKVDGEGDDGGDENSPDSEKGSSSSVAPSDVASSESKNGNSSSSSRIIASSSGAEQTSWPEGVKPSGYYAENCPASLECKDATTSFEYLNQEILAAGKYGEMLDTRDGQVYKTTEICDKENKNCQTWMAQNLNYDPGDVSGLSGILYVSKNVCYNEKADSCAKYGRLYTWEVAMNKVGCGYDHDCNNSSEGIQGICPVGWHLPSYSEFETLINYIDPSFGYGDAKSSLTAGKCLKASGGWNSSGNGEDSYGFSALSAGGFFSGSGGFNGARYSANLWSSTENDRDTAYSLYLNYNGDYTYLHGYRKSFAFSVRCLKD